ncbi:Tim17/Tim22/Tim23/Pmp24 family-domain-containing protein [Mycotypha africana]|uniref:Tim17/Tim22/Tim23/Pmp24 family-domain-containing protein n=1 Tax=Mycotypha africana TaxID=64632 RepID=UPI002300B83A|nr:Tim17/Tim22/Tim23/Pmp24 family-domain-containing protein [Mycotypha africana]KAI8991623.1 Tim17/Tim22/Tim23/Pmp24 family-domain-containing protein [Mycotypha africana]
MGLFSGLTGNKSNDSYDKNLSDTNTTDTSSLDDIYSSGGITTSETSFGDMGSDNSFEKLPDFMTGLNSYDTSRLQPVALTGGLDFLQIEGESTGTSVHGSSLTPSRGWSDDLCYGTGTSYLAGLTLGGAFGLAEGLKKSSGSPNMRVRLNTTLNSITRRGPGLGNSIGVIAMIYNGATAVIDASRGKHDIFNSVAGGALAGGLFKSTAGPRAAAVSAGVCAGVAGAWSVLVSNFSDK